MGDRERLPLEIAEDCADFHLSLSEIESLLQEGLYNFPDSERTDSKVNYK